MHREKPSGAFRFLIDFRRVNHLIRHDNDSNDFPITTLADASFGRKTTFCLTWLQPSIFCSSLADAQSVQLLAFNFFSRTFAFTRLAQGLSRFVSVFTAFVRKYLDACIAEDKCFKYGDILGTIAQTFEELLNNSRRILLCIRKFVVKLNI